MSVAHLKTAVDNKVIGVSGHTEACRENDYSRYQRTKCVLTKPNALKRTRTDCESHGYPLVKLEMFRHF
jgi:hypothetical protein